MLDFDMSFLYNKRKDVPLLRGRIFLVHLFTYPFLAYKIFNRNMDNLTIWTFSFYFFGSYFTVVACSIYHNSSCDVIDRSVYKRIDYSGIFLCNIAGVFPSIMYYIRSDLHIIMLVFHLLVNFYGALASLTTNFINTTKPWRVFLFWLSHSFNNFVLYNLLKEKLYFPSVVYVFGYFFYFIGAIIYSKEKPNPVKGFFEFHELAHLLYVFGAISVFYVNLASTGVLNGKSIWPDPQAPLIALN